MERRWYNFGKISHDGWYTDDILHNTNPRNNIPIQTLVVDDSYDIETFEIRADYKIKVRIRGDQTTIKVYKNRECKVLEPNSLSYMEIMNLTENKLEFPPYGELVILKRVSKVKSARN